MEKRKFSRVEFNVEIFISVGDKRLSGEVSNLSLKGVLIKMTQRIEVNCGEILDMELCVAGSSTNSCIKLKGIVVRNDDDGLAVRFEKIELDSFVHLRNIVAYNSGNYEKVMDELFELVKEGRDEKI